MKNRILWVDSLKAFAIIIVLLGHCLQFVGNNGLLYKYISIIQMSLFMAISGYCSYKPSFSFCKIKKRFLQLVIPFILWSGIWCVIQNGFNRIVDYYMWLPLNPDMGLWFLFVLFLISLVDCCRAKLLVVIGLRQQIGGG